MELKQTQKILLINFWFVLVVAFLLVVLYEAEILEPTDLARDRNLIFFLQVVMEFLTIAVIPVSLKLFSWKKIHEKLVRGKGASLLSWGTARINMLCLPMLVNVFLYYQTMSPSFGYMGIILFLCLFFVYPSMGRCYQETEGEPEMKEDFNNNVGD